MVKGGVVLRGFAGKFSQTLACRVEYACMGIVVHPCRVTIFSKSRVRGYGRLGAV